MKYAINLNQKTLIELAPNINIVQASILDFCISFINAKSSKIQRYDINGETYTYLSTKLIVKEMPLLKISNHRVIRRHIAQLEKAGLIKSTLINRNLAAFKLTEKIDQLVFSDLDFDLKIENLEPRQEGVALNSTTPCTKQYTPCTGKYIPPALNSTPINIINNNHINQSKDIDISNTEIKTKNLINDDLKFLFSEIKKHKVGYSKPSQILKQARKFFKTESDKTIILVLLRYWKKYNVSSGWNSGAWYVTDFLPETYDAYLKEKKKEEKTLKLQQEQEKQKKNSLKILEGFLNFPKEEQQDIINYYNQKFCDGYRKLNLDDIYMSKEIHIYENRYNFAEFLLRNYASLISRSRPANNTKCLTFGG